MSEATQQAAEFLENVFETTGLQLRVKVKQAVSGEVLDIEGSGEQQFIPLPDGIGFEVVRQQVTLYGRCEECRRKDEKPFGSGRRDRSTRFLGATQPAVRAVWFLVGDRYAF